MLGDTDVAVGGGAEIDEPRAATSLPATRWGARMGDTKRDRHDGRRADRSVRARCTWGSRPRTSPTKWEITREQQDAFAVESQRRAATAIAKGHFKEQIVPVELKTRKGTMLFDTDEHVRADATLEGLAKLKPAFQKENGTVTAGNASGINDGAAAVVLMERQRAEQRGLKPMARLVAYAHRRRRPEVHGHRPGAGVQAALERAGLTGRRHGRDRVERGVRGAGAARWPRIWTSTRPR